MVWTCAAGLVKHSRELGRKSSNSPTSLRNTCNQRKAPVPHFRLQLQLAPITIELKRLFIICTPRLMLSVAHFCPRLRDVSKLFQCLRNGHQLALHWLPLLLRCSKSSRHLSPPSRTEGQHFSSIWVAPCRKLGSICRHKSQWRHLWPGDVRSDPDRSSAAVCTCRTYEIQRHVVHRRWEGRRNGTG